MESSSHKAQVVYFSHGAGPLPLIGDPAHRMMNEFMTSLPEKLHKPDAIVVISAHWEEKVPTLLGAKSPKMLYDYYGFPQETYEISYPAPGNPELAKEIENLLKAQGIKAAIDTERGFDHGLFIPLMMIYPDADIPAIQLSLTNGLDPLSHIKLGRALKELLSKNILVIGSGFSFHNMMAFNLGSTEEIDDPQNNAFQEWLIDVCTAEMDCSLREEKLINWQTAPGAQYCHPREEHLLPLHLCTAMTGKKAELIFDDFIAGKRAVAFLWQ